MSWTLELASHTHVEEDEQAEGCLLLTCDGTDCHRMFEIDAGVIGHWESKADALSIACNGWDCGEPWYSPSEDVAYCYDCRQSIEHEHEYDDGVCDICLDFEEAMDAEVAP